MHQTEVTIIDCRIAADRIRPDGNEVVVSPDAETLARLAARLDLPAIQTLQARYRVKRRGRRVRVEGTLAANVIRTCVVTLENFEVSISEPVEVLFEDAPDPRRPSSGRLEVEVALDAEDPPEPIEDGRIDLGRVTEEFLALALEPHPRKPGVDFVATEPAPVPKEPSPFAGLAERLKRIDRPE